MTDIEARVKVIARDIVAITLANGFTPNTWELIPARCMLVVTELDEMIEAEPKDAPAELADVALRLLNILESVFPAWTLTSDRVFHPFANGPFKSNPDVAWPTVKLLCKAIRQWRQGDRGNTQTMLELALGACFHHSHVVNIDLLQAMEEKVRVVKGRPRLHGHVEPL